MILASCDVIRTCVVIANSSGIIDIGLASDLSRSILSRSRSKSMLLISVTRVKVCVSTGHLAIVPKPQLHVLRGTALRHSHTHHLPPILVQLNHYGIDSKLFVRSLYHADIISTITYSKQNGLR